MPKKPKLNYSSPDGQIHTRDQFQTPMYAVEPLLPFIYKYNFIWESAAGQGYLARHLRNLGFHVTATDLATGTDYFTTPMPEPCEVQITNPPFSLKYKWIARACELGPFALLVPSDVLFAGKYCQPLIQRYGLELLVPNKRINYKTPNKGWNESAAQMHTSWLTYGLNIGQLITFVDIYPCVEEDIDEERITSAV